ncbi:MAG: succinyldiaminopimelate transaminase [Saccharospirillaceae bacterium]|nr:succinyldiaminopimelate transaminase [Pseudomonadales bacterium]NRB80661.1 succinyldiaminopimelate transaminase [Saccharospirillaceae bacterium]
MNPKLKLLQPYPFEKLAQLFAQVTPNPNLDLIALTVGEPKHKSPEFVLQCFNDNNSKLASYPATAGTPELRSCIVDWLTKRFDLNVIDPDKHIISCNGTREALFAFTQAMFDDTNKQKPFILTPNPFYQIYEGAAILAGAQPYFVDLDDKTFLADFSNIEESVWQKTQIVFLCSPGNPTGAVVGFDQLKKLLELSDKYDFIIASDECYSEIYFKETPIGLLEACAKLGRDDYKNAVVFHSLSKRSNLPGLRSGFVAGDEEVIQAFKLYRTYHGSAMSLTNQMASIAAWSDESHVQVNRDLYQIKFAQFYEIVSKVLPINMPDASFYFWLPTPENGKIFAAKLLEKQNIKVLPGEFLAREVNGTNPGDNFVRIALVATQQECLEAANRIAQFIKEEYK